MVRQGEEHVAEDDGTLGWTEVSRLLRLFVFLCASRVGGCEIESAFFWRESKVKLCGVFPLPDKSCGTDTRTEGTSVTRGASQIDPDALPAKMLAIT